MVARFLVAVAASLLSIGGALADPPGRVGRVSLVEGGVSLRASYAEVGERATLNWPITSGGVLQTGVDGLAEVRIGSSSIALDRSTELEFGQLDDHRVGLRLIAGSVAIRVNEQAEAADFSIGTVHGQARLDDVGRYRFEVTRRETIVSVHQGAARIDIAAGQILVAAGRRVEIWGAGATDHRASVPVRDAFDEWVFRREQGASYAVSAQYVSPEMTGHEELDRHGDWQTLEDHGPVWFPRNVPFSWAPYRDGRWTWIAPWGWTWVDAAPWGFAPSHYGRWIQIGTRWCWSPGPYARRPVYAPALVAWHGHPGTYRQHGPQVGWTVLGPRDTFRPGYHHSPRYADGVNHFHRREFERPRPPAPAVPLPLPAAPPQVGHYRPILPAPPHAPVRGHDRPPPNPPMTTIHRQTPAPVVIAPPQFDHHQHHHRPRPPHAMPQVPAPIAIAPPQRDRDHHRHHDHHRPRPPQAMPHAHESGHRGYHRVAPPVALGHPVPPAPHAAPQPQRERRHDRR